MKQFWLMKSEPDEVSIDDALGALNQTVSWFGVRNYQARNFMRDAMRPGDDVLFYHSSCALPGIAGFARIASKAYPDATQFDPSSPYFDASARRDKPRWVAIDVQARSAIDVITLPMLREQVRLADMRVLARGNRLSITPVTAAEFKIVKSLAKERLIASPGRVKAVA